jgi:hypothetical protein
MRSFDGDTMTNVDFTLARYADGTLIISMAPPVAIGGWNLRLQVLNNFGGISGLIQKYSASGLNGMSGITITDSGNGVMQIQFNSQDTSGMDYGNYAMILEKLNSGSRTPIAEGFLTIGPTGGV